MWTEALLSEMATQLREAGAIGPVTLFVTASQYSEQLRDVAPRNGVTVEVMPEQTYGKPH